ncbi:hypothetical protein ACIQOW_08510 [Kitasatospora sp. NPDC091335]|uniref:hypothetical protein n=1 Tax=Kitasatospora sp. NPDC091335 TaxID=3364085 RepID=UPI00381DD80C
MTIQPAYAIGDRVRTNIDLAAADWAPEQPDFPAGALGTVDSVDTGRCGGLGVLLDDDPVRMPLSMTADEVEAVGSAR